MFFTDEWKEKGMCDDNYLMVHVPCGTRVQIVVGNCAICPKCQPEEWAKAKREETE